MTVEGEYRTHLQMQCCMAPHAIVADWRDDGLTVHMSTQFTAAVRAELAKTFDLPLERVRVVVDGRGGGFGSKSSLGNYGRSAVALSRQAKAPVRPALERHEEHLDSGNRPDVWQKIAIGAHKDGALTAIKLAIDPLPLRHRIDPNLVWREEPRLGAERIGWPRRHAPGADPGPVKRSLGMAQSSWGANAQLTSSCAVSLARDGTVAIASGVQDIGTGVGTVMAQTVAEVFGIKPQDIRVRIGDTDFPSARHRMAAGPPLRPRHQSASRRGAFFNGCSRRRRRFSTPRRKRFWPMTAVSSSGTLPTEA